MLKLLYKPVAIVAGIVGGLLSGLIFKRIWKVVGRGSDAPAPLDSERGWGEVLLASVLQGAIYAVGQRHSAPARTGSASMTSLHGGSLRSYGASGSNSTRTPMPRNVSKLAPNAGWLASWGLQCGTTTTGTP